MTTIQTNKLGLDIVDIQIECTGTSQTDMFFQEPVLDQARDYVLGISELSVPLAEENLITSDPSLLAESIMQFRKRRDLLGPLQVRLQQGAADPPGYISNEMAHFRLNRALAMSPADLVHALSRFVFGFQEYANGLAVGNDYKISLYATPSGILRLRGDGQFWEDYIIQLTAFGREILGFDNEFVGVAQPDSTVPATTTDLIAGANFVTNHANFTKTTREVVANHSVFRYVENRLRVEVDADLAIPSNILVENGVHKLHYNVASYALPNSFKASGTVDTHDKVNTGITHITHLHVGNTVLKKKESPTTDWYKLMSAANVQNMRLHLLLVRRVWDRRTESWRLTRDKLKIAENATWFATMKFVEQF